MKRRIFIAGALLLSLVVVESAAQEVIVRIPGLEKNKDYIALLQRDERLRQQSDSLMLVMREVRGSLRENAELKDSLVDMRADSMRLILSETESAMYSLRNQKIKVVDQINSVEQEFVFASMGNIGNAKAAEGSGSIFTNKYFKGNLLPEDLKALSMANAKEQRARELAMTYAKNYTKIKSLYDKYLIASTEADAEALYGDIEAVTDENMITERQLSKLWTEIYDQKTYVYSYFLEKESREDILELTENMIMEANQQKLLSIDNCISEPVVDYCLQKPILLNYELYVAKLLNLTPAIDSLTNAAKVVRQIDYRMPIIDIERRSFVTYEAIEFSPRSPYNSSNPIPETIAYEYGTIYRILLGNYKYKQSVSIFRGASPLSVEVGEDGRYSYYAGGFKSRDEADAALLVMKKKGFRNPQIVEWCDGRKTNLSELGDGEVVSYRLKITGGALDDTVREIITTMAEECSITKIAEDSFVVGMFQSPAMAERVAQAVRKCDDKLSVEVVEIRPEVPEEEEE